MKKAIIATSYSHLEDELLKWSISKNKYLYNWVKSYDLFCLKKFDKVVVQTDLLINTYINRGLKNANVHLIKQSVYDDRSNYIPSRIITPDFKILYFGSFVKVQNIELIYDIAQLLIHHTDIKFLLIGADIIYSEYHSKSIEKGKLYNVEILPRMEPDNIKEYIKKADVLISVRTYGKDTPIKIFHYLSFGRCILATDLPIHNAVLNKDIAVLVKPDAKSFAYAIENLFQNRDLLLEYSRNAYDFYQKHYSFAIMKSKYYELLR